MPTLPDYKRAANALEHILNREGFSLEIESVSRRPDRSTGWDANAFHFLFKVTGPNGFERSGCYSMGSGLAIKSRHPGQPPRPPRPTLADIVSSLAMDAQCVESVMDRAEFLTEYGYTDSAQGLREGMKAWTDCVDTRDALLRLPERTRDAIYTLSGML